MQLVRKQVADIEQLDVAGTVLDAAGGQELLETIRARTAEGIRRFVVNLTDAGPVSGDAAGCLVDARRVVLAANGHFALVLPDAGVEAGSGWSDAPWRFDRVEDAIASLLRK